MAIAMSRFNDTIPAQKPLADEMRRWHPIVASNRGPAEHTFDADGALIVRMASGGVASALSGLASHLDFTWVASAATEGDRLVATRHVDGKTANPRLRFVLLPADVYDRHYNLFCNPLLWFLQHSLWPALSQRAIDFGLTAGWFAGYRPANAAFASNIVAEARQLGDRPVVLLQDYHLYLVAGFLRRMLPEALLQHFVHIPWPAPAAWRVLPPEVRETILRSLLANDVVGFQTARDAGHFLQGCASFLPEVDVDHLSASVMLGDHKARVRVYPISIDVLALRNLLASAEVAEHYRRMRDLKGERTIVRVDRLDPSKDVANGFRAFGRLLDDHPEWRGRVKFLAFLVPSRATIPEYRRYAEETFSLVAEINTRHGREGYQPIEIFYENNRAQAMAGLKLYDVLLVNPLADGMNLVAKEGVIANDADGVLVLSERAGVHDQLGTGALSVTPGDVVDIAAALARALTMPAKERRLRAALLRELVTRADLSLWLRSQLDDLRQLSGSFDRLSKRSDHPQSPAAWLCNQQSEACLPVLRPGYGGTTTEQTPSQ